VLPVDPRAAEAPPAAEAPRALPLNRPLAVAYAADTESESVLRSVLAEVGGGVTFQRGTVVTAIRDLARNPTPQVLVVDVAGAADPLVALDDLANVCEPDVKVLVIGDRTDVGFYREITRRLGVLEYLYKPLTRDNVARLFLPVVKGRLPGGGAQVGGRVVTVTPAHGGAGATTVAANLATQIADTSRGYVALVDLNLQNGAAALALGLAPGAGLRVALEEPGRVDELFIERTAVSVSDRLRLIAADEPLEATPRPTVEGVSRLMAMLRRRFNYIIVDMPNPADAALRTIYPMAQTRLLVITPSLASLRGAARFRSMLKAVAGDEQAITVLNHAGLPGGLPPAMLEQGLAEKPGLALPHMPKHVLVSANLGVPAVTRSRGFAAAMLRLTREVSGLRTRKAGWLDRLLGR
jgi:pilus assembly protein CpaE